MTDNKKSPSDFEAQFDDAERDLIKQQKIVSRFVIQTGHGAKAVRKHLQKVCDQETWINDAMDELLKLKNTSEEFKAEAPALCLRARDLKQYTRDMNNALYLDLARHKYDLPTKVSFLTSMIFGPWVAVQKGFGNGTITPDYAAGAGGLLGLGVIFLSKIDAGFRAAGKAICSTPKQIRAEFRAASKAVYEAPQQIWDSNSFIYVRETIKEKRRVAQKALNTWKLKV